MPLRSVLATKDSKINPISYILLNIFLLPRLDSGKLHARAGGAQDLYLKAVGGESLARRGDASAVADDVSREGVVLVALLDPEVVTLVEILHLQSARKDVLPASR